MTQPTTTTPLDDPATVTAIITEAAARSAGGALGGQTGAHRLIVQLCADAVAPVVQQLVRDRDEALAERDAAKLTVAHVEQRCAEYAIALHETLGEGDEARIRAEAAEAELAACRPSGIRVIGGGPAGELKGWPRSTVGICGDQCATIGDSAALIVCSLPFGHGGWHQESDGGAKWSSTAASPRPILSAVEPEETL